MKKSRSFLNYDIFPFFSSTIYLLFSNRRMYNHPFDLTWGFRISNGPFVRLSDWFGRGYSSFHLLMFPFFFFSFTFFFLSPYCISNTRQARGFFLCSFLFGTRENEEMKLPASHDLADVMREVFFFLQ